MADEKTVANVEDVKELLDTFAKEKMEKYFAEKLEVAKKEFRFTDDVEKVEKAEKMSETAQFLKALGSNDGAFLKNFSEMRAKAIQLSGTDALGGYLVPEDFEQGVRTIEYNYNQIRSNAFVMPMAHEVMRLNVLSAEPTVNIVGEAVAQTTATTVTFTEPVLTARKYLAYTGWSSELYEDGTEINLVSLLQERFAIAIASKEQTEFITGTVSGSEGLLKVTGVTGITLNSGTTFSNITWDDLKDMQTELQGISVAEDVNAKYYMHPSVWNTLTQSKASTSGNYFVGSPQLGVAPQAWGREVVLSNSMPSTTATATKFVFYTNLKKTAVIGDRKGMAVKIFDSGIVDSAGSNVNLIQSDAQAIRVTQRTGFCTNRPTLIVTLATN